MTKRDIAGYLEIDTKTLYNWENDKPNLYKTVMKGLAYDEIVELTTEISEKAQELKDKFEKQVEYKIQFYLLLTSKAINIS